MKEAVKGAYNSEIKEIKQEKQLKEINSDKVKIKRENRNLKSFRKKRSKIGFIHLIK